MAEQHTDAITKTGVNHPSTDEQVAAEISIPAAAASPAPDSSVAGSIPSFQ